MKTARVSITIVCKKTLLAVDTNERVLRNAVDEMTNTIVNE
jgi:hypothetical protein